MPYKVLGSKVLHQKGGKWKVKQTCGSPTKARAAMRLLYGIEHGMVVRGSKAGAKKK